ncbi:MAG: ribosomal protein S18-alanine N-acetyltransferase [Caldilineales bacterium]|nr:ribosomal protein S18-alanine N-acetyltransferase [Caldilineales bacterium]MDW8316803.1 ribosomal protein S18-alanine N-acetyltransferase [Anaerolineae bacterium]
MSRSWLWVRPMRPEHLPAVMAIENRVFIGDAWPESIYRRYLDAEDMLYCVLELTARQPSGPSAEGGEAEEDGYGLPPTPFAPPPGLAAPADPTLLGYAGCWLVDEEAHLMTIAVAPEWQGLGLGEWLLLQVLDLVERRGAEVCTLEVRVSNQVAQALYRRLGFRVEGRRRRYYTDNNEDALIMTSPPLWSEAMRSLREVRRAALVERLGGGRAAAEAGRR